MVKNVGVEKQKTLRSELRNIPQIKNVTISDYLPVSGAVINYNSFWKNGREKEDLGVGAQIWRIDEDYLNTLDIKLLKGRNFSREMASDSQAVIFNETMAKKLGLIQPIDQVINNGFESPYHIIGVVQDFHFQSLKGEIEGLCLVRGNLGSIFW